MSPEKTAPDFHEVASEAAAQHVFPTTFAHRRLWFLERLLPGKTSYLIPWFLRIWGRLNVTARKKSLNEVGARHEVSPTTLCWKGGTHVRVVPGTLSVPLPVAAPWCALSCFAWVKRNTSFFPTMRHNYFLMDGHAGSSPLNWLPL